MRRFRVLLAAVAVLGLGAGTSLGARFAGADTTTAETTATAAAFAVAVRVVSVANLDGIFRIVLACPGTAACRGTYGLPAYDSRATAFAIAPGKQWTHRQFIAGPLHAKASAAKTIAVVVTQTAADGTQATVARTVALLQKAAATGAGPGAGAAEQDNGGGPRIAPGPKSRTEVVRDARGDNRSSFPLPIVYDIVRATATRRGNAVVFSITTIQPMTMRNEGGLVTPCIEVPYDSPSIHPLFTFGGGQLPLGPGKSATLPVRVSGNRTTVQWTVPHRYLFKLGFRWRAVGACDPAHLADVAPNTGYETFRWVKIKKAG